MEKMINTLDGIVKALSTGYAPNVYLEKKEEIRGILITTVGREHELFKRYEALIGSKGVLYSDICRTLIGIVNGLKAHLLWQKDSEKRYQFFISSTFLDLESYRKAVADEIVFKGQFFVGMEDFNACGENLESYIKREIDQSDYYILLLGQRWGTPSRENNNISYTMMEYNYAKSKGMIIIPMIYCGKEVLNGNDLDVYGKQFDSFKKEVSESVVQYFKNEDELKRLISRAIDNAIKNYPQKGWVRL